MSQWQYRFNFQESINPTIWNFVYHLIRHPDWTELTNMHESPVALKRQFKKSSILSPMEGERSYIHSTVVECQYALIETRSIKYKSCYKTDAEGINCRMYLLNLNKTHKFVHQKIMMWISLDTYRRQLSLVNFSGFCRLEKWWANKGDTIWKQIMRSIDLKDPRIGEL